LKIVSTCVSHDNAGGFTDLRRMRISGTAVPEPATATMLAAGLAMLAACGLGRLGRKHIP
jgi:hypothetical protein